jgi:ABC-type multidrug transport system fused ATPase/permease subunit
VERKSINFPTVGSIVNKSVNAWTRDRGKFCIFYYYCCYYWWWWLWLTVISLVWLLSCKWIINWIIIINVNFLLMEIIIIIVIVKVVAAAAVAAAIVVTTINWIAKSVKWRTMSYVNRIRFPARSDFADHDDTGLGLNRFLSKRKRTFFTPKVRRLGPIFNNIWAASPNGS